MTQDKTSGYRYSKFFTNAPNLWESSFVKDLSNLKFKQAKTPAKESTAELNEQIINFKNVIDLIINSPKDEDSQENLLNEIKKQQTQNKKLKQELKSLSKNKPHEKETIEEIKTQVSNFQQTLGFLSWKKELLNDEKMIEVLENNLNEIIELKDSLERNLEIQNSKEVKNDKVEKIQKISKAEVKENKSEEMINEFQTLLSPLVKILNNIAQEYKNKNFDSASKLAKDSTNQIIKITGADYTDLLTKITTSNSFNDKSKIIASRIHHDIRSYLTPAISCIYASNIEKFNICYDPKPINTILDSGLELLNEEPVTISKNLLEKKFNERIKNILNRPANEKNIFINTTVDNNIKTDGEIYLQTLLNALDCLVNNAIDHGINEQDSSIQINVKEVGEELQLSVTSANPMKADPEKIFEKIVTTRDNPTETNGKGLFDLNKLLKLAGGKLAYKSPSNTTFTAALPILNNS
ncbi:MAG: hypothetical protein HRT47_03715 [Candidatus Caenarcaniphilales bacterium]|nr:hypothetical protein [Candidatus Caenarcaniphilales bacterium]